MNKSIDRWLVLVLCLFSFARGVYRAGEPSMWWDESLSHYRAARPIPFILSNQILFQSGTTDLRTVDNHPPLYFVLLRLAILAAGDGEFAMRFLSVACGVLIVPTIYRCGMRLFGRGSALIASLVASMSPLYLWYQHEIRPYTMVALLGLASFYALMHVVGRRSADRGTGRRPWFLFYVLSVAAMLTTHYLGFLLLAAEGLILLVSWVRYRLRLWWVVLALGVLAGAIFAWGLSAMPEQTEIPSFGYLPVVTLVNDVFQQFTLGLYADVLWPVRWMAIGLLAAALVVLLVGRRPTTRRHTVYALLCFALPVVEVYALSLLRPAYMNIRHLIYASPFYYMLLSAGVARAKRSWARIPMAVAWGAVVVGMALSTLLYYDGVIDGKADHRAWGRYLSEHVRPTDLVVVNPVMIAELYEYYVDSPAPWIGLPTLPDTGETVPYLRQAVRDYDRVWVAHSSTPAWANPGNLPLRWLGEWATQVDYANFESATSSLHVSAFRAARPPVQEVLPDSVQPLALGFGDRLRLIGLSSTVDRVAAGHVLQLSLYWSPIRQVERDYRVALSLTDDQGFTWAKADYAPVQGSYPTSQWPADGIIRDDIDLRVSAGAPPGRYWLNASLYPADRSGPTLPVSTLEDDRLLGLIVPIGQIEVTRPDRPPMDRDLPIEYPVHRRYGDLSLLGHSYGGGAYQPGDIVLLDATWRAVWRPAVDLTFDVQLVDEGGRVVASRTIEPAGSYVPSQWHKGEVVRGQHRFRIPVDVPPGKYVLALAPGGERPYHTLWPWDSGRVTLNALTVNLAGEGRTFEVPDMQVAIGANLGDRVELLGIDVASESIRPGQVVSCTLYWRALDVANQNYTVFTHLVADDGQTWGQWDNQPQRGMMPTTRWVPGQVVADPYQIPVSAQTPVGRLDLQVGMYDLQTMIRLPIYDENGQIAGDAVTAIEIEVAGR